MPVILSQIFEATDRIYKDAEGSLYHYPRQYFSRIRPYDSFIYYRPAGRGRALRSDSAHYFGHGILGMPHDDLDDDRSRFVPLLKHEYFPTLVPIRDQFGRYYETESDRPPPFVSAVRTISDITYQRILATAQVPSAGVSFLPSTEDLVATSYTGSPVPPPTDAMRRIEEIPAGAGYTPNLDHKIDPQESAALQERARADHQTILRKIGARIKAKGGWFWYNNHLDLVAEFDGRRELIEAKSLTNLRDAVNRMRYGLGQLMDYQVRYRSELQGAMPMLAFGRPPDRETSFISTILQENGVAFISQYDGDLLPLNDHARGSRLFA